MRKINVAEEAKQAQDAVTSVAGALEGVVEAKTGKDVARAVAPIAAGVKGSVTPAAPESTSDAAPRTPGK